MEETDDDMMNIPKSLHGEDMSSRHVVNKLDDEYDTNSEPLGEDQSSPIPLIKSQSKHMILGSQETHIRTPTSNTYTKDNDPHKSTYELKEYLY